MSYKYIIFDFDGTVLNTLDDLTTSVNYALNVFSFPQRTKSEIRIFVGNGMRKLIERSVPENTGNNLTDNVFSEFKSHYKIHCNDKTVPYNGINELLCTLKNNGMKIAVVSNKSHSSVMDLCSYHFPGVFDCIIGQKDGIRKKPFPDSVNTAISILNGNKNETVYIGDSEVDVATARNAGIDCISVLWGFRTENELLNSGATVLASDTDCLKKLLLS